MIAQHTGTLNPAQCMSEVGDTRGINHPSRAIKFRHVRLIRYKCLYNRVFKTVASRFIGDVQERGTELHLEYLINTFYLSDTGAYYVMKIKLTMALTMSFPYIT